MYPTTVELKAAIIDTVSSGDDTLQSLLTINIDLLWALNQRRSTALPILYLYVQAEACRFGMAYARTQIDKSRADSNAFNTRHGNNSSSRDYTANNSEQDAAFSLGSGDALEVNSRHTDSQETAAASENTSGAATSSSNSSDVTTLGYASVGSSGERTESSTHNKSLDYETSGAENVSVTKDKGYVIDDSFWQETGDINTLSSLIPVRIMEINNKRDSGFKSYAKSGPPIDGADQSYIGTVQLIDSNNVFGHGSITSKHESHAYHGTYNKNIVIGGGSLTVAGTRDNAPITYLKVSDSNVGAGTLSGQARGTDINGVVWGAAPANTNIIRIQTNAINTSDTEQTSGNSSSIGFSNSRAAMTGASTDVTRSEEHALAVSENQGVSVSAHNAHGESNEMMAATVDAFSQLFTNLRDLYNSILAEIKAQEQQIVMDSRYTLGRMTTRYPVINGTCNTIPANPTLRGFPGTPF